jgi:hypothetical protein
MEHIRVGKWKHDKRTDYEKTMYCWAIGDKTTIQGNCGSPEKLAYSINEYEKRHKGQLFLGSVQNMNRKNITPAVSPLDKEELTSFYKSLEALRS